MNRLPLLLSLFLFAAVPVHGSERVLNNGFEMESTFLWTETGTILPSERGVTQYNVSGTKVSWAYYQHPGDDFEGGVEQTVYLEAGETYRVEADFCYHNC